MDFYENRLVFLAQDQDDSPEQIPGAPEEAETLEEKKEELMEESQLDRTDILLESKETDYDKIKNIDINLPPEKQEERVQTMESVLHFVFIKALAEHSKADIISSHLLIKDFTKNKEERAAAAKIEEILGDPNCEMFAWLKKWPELVEYSEGMYEGAKQLKDDVEGGRTNIGKKVGNTLIAAGLIAAGAYGAYKLYKWFKKPKEERDEKTNAVKEEGKKVGRKALWAAGGVAGAIGLMTLGALISPDHVGEWISKYMGINITPGTLKKALPLLFTLQLKKFWAAITEDLETSHPFIAYAADVIDVEPKNLLLLKDKEYDEFMKFRARSSRTARSLIYDVMPDIGTAFVLPSKAEKQEEIESEIRIYKFLKAHEADIEKIKPEPKTIEDVLLGLEELGVLEEVAAEQKEKGEDKEPGGKSQEEVDELTQRLFPNAALHWARMGKAVEDGEWGKLPEESMSMVTATVSDGGYLIIEKGVLYAVKAEGVLVVSSCNIIIESVLGLLEGGPVEGLKGGWQAGGAYFLIGGATLGAITAPRTQGAWGIAKGVARGTVRGAAAPVEVINIHVNAGQRLWRERQNWYYRGKEITPSPQARLEALHARTKLHAELYKKYSTYAEPETIIGKTAKWLEESRILKLRERHGRLFRESYNAYVRELSSYTTKGGLKNGFNILGHNQDMISKKGTLGAWEDSAAARRDDLREIADDFAKDKPHGRARFYAETEVDAYARKLAKKAGVDEAVYADEFREQARRELSMRGREILPKNPEITSMGVADKMGLPKIRPEQIAKLTELGVEEGALLRMRELRMTEDEIGQVIKELEKAPQAMKKLKRYMIEKGHMKRFDLKEYRKFKTFSQTGIAPSNKAITSMAEADKMGLIKIKPEQLTKLRQFGVSEPAILRMRELGLGTEDIDDALKIFEKDRNAALALDEFLTQSRYSKWSPYLKKAKQFGGVAIIALLATGYENAPNKREWLERTTVELTGAGVGAGVGGAVGTRVGMALAGGAAGSKLPGALKFVGIIGGGFLGAVGAEKVWTKTGGYMLDKYCPDRELKYQDPGALNWTEGIDSLLFTLGGAATGVGEYALDRAGAFRVTPGTDPIAYLEDEAVMLRPIGEPGWHESIFKGQKTHDIDQLRTKAAKAVTRKEKRLEELNQKLEKADDNEKIAKLEGKIEQVTIQLEYLQSLADDSWIENRRNALLANEIFVIYPAIEKFRELAEAEFKEEGSGDLVLEIAESAAEGSKIQQTRKHEQVWEALFSKTVEVEIEIPGEESFTEVLNFRDLILLIKISHEQTEFLKKFD